MKNLIESIKTMYQPQSEATMMKSSGEVVHNCAKHVEHRQYGKGATIAEEHADPDRYGNIAWYDIEFAHGIEKGVPVSELKVLASESHGHSTKKAKKMAEEDDLSMSKNKVKGKSEDDDADDKNEKDDDDDMEDDDDDQPMKGKKKVSENVQIVMSLEEFNALDEVSKATLASYAKKATHDARIQQSIGKDFERHAMKSRKPSMKASAQSLADKYKSKSRSREAGIGKAIDRLAMEEVQVDETITYADLQLDISEAQKSSGYDAHFRAMMAKHGIKHPGELDTPEKKKAFFNKVDASYKAKNEEVFLEAALAEAQDDVKAAHRKAGNRVSDEKTGTKDGKAFHSFVVTQPSGKRTRHIYHGSTKKLETMSPAPRSKESSEQDLDDK